jgi:hypothetical protein
MFQRLLITLRNPFRVLVLALRLLLRPLFTHAAFFPPHATLEHQVSSLLWTDPVSPLCSGCCSPPPVGKVASVPPGRASFPLWLLKSSLAWTLPWPKLCLGLEVSACSTTSPLECESQRQGLATVCSLHFPLLSTTQVLLQRRHSCLLCSVELGQG